MSQAAKESQKPVHEPNRSAKAVAKYLRIAPRKMRLVIDAIRHQPAQKAFVALMVLKKKAARMVEKVLKSAVANAKVLGLDENRLVVSDIRADGGPTMKRFMSRSMGRADRIIKRTTHLSLVVEEGQKSWGASHQPSQAADEKAGDASKAKSKSSPKKKMAAGKA